MSLAKKGKHISPSTEFKKGNNPWVFRDKSFRHSEETKKKMSEAKKGKPHFYCRGEKNPNWKGTEDKSRHRLKGQIEYVLWRTAVFTRDNYTCQNCGKSKCYVEADHIKPWALYPELRYALDNGRTLCLDCHRQTDTWGWKTRKFILIKEVK